MRVAYTGALVGTQTAAGATLPTIQPANQTFEILADITAERPGHGSHLPDRRA